MKEMISTKDIDELAAELRLISLQEACERLGIGHWSIYQLINKNHIKTVKIGARRLISLKALNAFIRELEEKHEAQSKR